MDSNDLLVTLLAVGMSVVLLFTIVTLYYAIRILRSLRTITDRAEHIAHNVDVASDFFKKTAGPAAIGKLIANLVDVMKNRGDGKGKDE